MLISVILTTYRRTRLMRRALESVVNQTLPSDYTLQVLVSDDDFDGSAIPVVSDVRMKAPPHVSVEYIQRLERTRGVSASRNRALGRAVGEWVVFLDDDDLLTQEAIGSLVEQAVEEGADFCAGQYLLTEEDGNGNALSTRAVKVPAPSYDMLLVRNFFPIGSFAIRREAIRVPFNSNLKTHEDWLFLVDNLRDTRVTVIPQTVLEIRQSIDGSREHRNKTGGMLQTAADYARVYSLHPAAHLLAQRETMLASLGGTDLNNLIGGESRHVESFSKSPFLATRQGKYLICNESETIQASLRSKGFFEPLPALLATAFAPKLSGCVVDVGANIGVFSVPVALALPGTQVFAVEPQRMVFMHLCANLLANRVKNVRPLNVAVGENKAGLVGIKVPFFDIFEERYTGSVSLDEDVHAIRRGIAGVAEPATWAESYDRVDLQGLDHLCKNQSVSFIKVDVEGMELSVLKSGEGILRHQQPTLFFEAWSLGEFEQSRRELLTYVSELGYAIIEIGDDCLAYHPKRLSNTEVNEALSNCGISFDQNLSKSFNELDDLASMHLSRIAGTGIIDFNHVNPDSVWNNVCRMRIGVNFESKIISSIEASSIQVLISHENARELKRTKDSLDSQTCHPASVLFHSIEAPIKNTLEGGCAEWTLLLSAGDELEQISIALLNYFIGKKANSNTKIIYFDNDDLDESGSYGRPIIKPEFNHDLLMSFPYMGRVLVVRTDWLKSKLDEATMACDLVLAHRLVLAADREGGRAGFLHIPMVLAHLISTEPNTFATTSHAWQSMAKNLLSDSYVGEPLAHVLEGPSAGTFHLIYPLQHTPRVSIVIPTRDQLAFISRCIESLLDKTDYPNYEMIVVDNDSQTPEAQVFLSGLEQVDPDRIRVLRVPGPFNFSRMNNLAVAQARGEFILLLNNDTAVLHADWLSHMMRHALRDGVGVVGARLVYPEGTVQHAGVIMGLRGPADHPCLGLKPDEPGYMFRAQLTQNFSAVTAACMLVSKAVYEEVGGLDEVDFAVSYNDVDFCLKVGQTGRRIVWTPLATLLHEGSASQKASIENLSQAHKAARFTQEQAAMYRKWPEVIANDPAYNPNLSLVERGYEVETNPLLCYDPLRDFYEHKVVAFAADNMGCGNYRVFQPMQAMLKDDLCTGGASPELFGPNLVLRSRADVLIFQRPNDDAGIHTLESLIPLKGIKKIYEVDDNLTRIPMKSAHHGHMPKDIRKRMLKSMGLCDRLVVSTPPLAQEFKHANDDVRVVLNRLPPAMWGETPPVVESRNRAAGTKPVVAWAGGVGHGGDLDLVAQVIKELADVVDFEFFGMCPDAIRPYVKRVHSGVPTLEYPAKLMQLAQHWDLAIAPLEVNAFNESKSNLRLLEYGWCGLPVVCSDVTPYQNPLFPVTRVKNRHKDWKAAILDKVNDRDAARAQGMALQSVVNRDWMLRGEHVVNWYKAWTD